MSESRVRRVLMTTDTVGGVWTFTAELARVLASRGIEIVLAALGGQPSPDQCAEAAAITGVCLLGSDFKLEWMEEPWADVDASKRWLMQLAHEYSPDLVHLNSFCHGGMEWDAPVVLTAHSCVVSWWKAVRGGNPPAEWNRYRAEVTRALQSADRITAPSTAMALTLQENYAARNASPAIQTVYNGVQAHRSSSVRKKPVIFSAGRLWDEAKNAGSLASIANHLSWPVYLAGDCGAVSNPHCSLLGKLSRSEMSDWYASASIYALPARYEPFGLSVLEAALAKCALVLGDIPSLREIWDGAALFVNPERPEELREAIDQLIGDPALREEICRQSFGRASTLTAERMAGRYLEIYECVAAETAGQCVS